MAQPVIQPSFASGELSPALYSRVDFEKFHIGAALLRNFFVDYRGGVSNRTGTAYTGRAKATQYVGTEADKHRLIPFTFSTTQTYALLFGDQYMRVIMNGGFVLEPAVAISSITQSNPGTVTATVHGYSNGDTISFGNIAGMTQLSGKTLLAANVTANTFTMTDLDGVPVNTSSYGAYAGGGTVARVYTLATPYAAADLELIKFTQSADTMTLCHPGYSPYQLTRSQHWVWTLTAVTFQSSAAAPTNLSVVNNGVGTTYNNTAYAYVVTAQTNASESLPSNIATISCHALGQNTGAQNTLQWASVAGATLYNLYRTQENIGNNAIPNGALFGYIGSVSPGATNSFVDNNIAPDFTRCPPTHNNPFSSGNNPSCTCYYQQRQVYGGMVNAPEELVFSKSGDFLNMDYSSPSRADDSIEVSLASQQVNAIKHMIGMNSLIVLTASGAWRVDGGAQSTALTPSAIEAVPQAYRGCSDVPPIAIDYDILYVQARGATVRDLQYNFYVNLYTGVDITVLSSHLFVGHQIIEWAYAEEPYKLIWCVREDGILLSLTYLKEQDVIAWARHDTAGKFRSVCSIIEGDENAVYFVVERNINGRYLQFIERMASRNMGGDPTLGIPADVSQAWFVDAGLQYPLSYPAATLTPQSSAPESIIEQVHVVFGGSGYTNPTISDLSGSGAVFAPVVVGGAIVAVNVISNGVVTIAPKLEINDPSGAGAVLTPVVQTPVTFTASAGVFSLSTPGSTLRINGGVGTVTQASATQIVANMTQAMTTQWPAPAGSWSCTAPVSTVSGLDHLNGQTVSILADGNVQPQQTVANGQITLQQPATSVVVGLPYQSQLESLYLDVPGGPATVQSKRKKINAVTVRVTNTRGLKAGPNFSTLREIKERGLIPMGQAIPLFTGDERVVIDPLWSVPAQICLQQDNPLPCTVLGLIPEVSIGDTP
ncbi:ubiquitin-activating E1 FCCH domain-containing protein [Paraburkholderia kururiensis]|uniref:ubiquitin-activating E1 FCCH domain-containing protein n=1 Tax=Paraburkholderia kururiensis TaxID=984307 RepID=UPI000346A09C|nr:ubiquitin-activating E1 FCCH domain-containing protein [Paraburkholderia kururiensis]